MKLIASKKMFKYYKFNLILLTCFYIHKSNCNSEFYANELLVNDKSTSAKRCHLLNCSITCMSRSYETLEEDLAFTLNFNSYCHKIQYLVLMNITFKNGLLPKVFLGVYQNSIVSLSLENCNIRYIESGAFANGSFEEINLINLQLKELRTSYFVDINNDFVSLRIQQYDFLPEIEENFFCDLSDKLTVLRLQVGLTKLHEYFKCTNFRQLITLNLKGNNFVNRLKFDAFITFLSIQYLNLSYCKINFLPSNIFSYIMDTIIYLDLSHNHLKNYWPMMFGYMRLPSVASVNMLNNEFECSCSLFEIWSTMSTQVNDINCWLPQDKSILQPLSPALCFPLESEILMANSSINVFDQNNCKDLYDASTKVDYFKLAFGLLNPEKPMEVNSTAIIIPANIDVIAFNKFEKKVMHLQDFINGRGMEDLQLDENEPYTLCVLRTNSNQLDSPFNCRSFKRKSKQKAWLHSKYFLIVLIVIIVSSLICIFIGLIGACSIIKHRPTLIRGSKRIIKQRLHSDGIIVLPKRCSKKILMQKEQEIAEMKRNALNQTMLPEVTSLESSLNDNYIIDNIYEAVPAYMKLRDQPPEAETTTLIDTEENYNWMYASSEFAIPTVIISEHTDDVDVENN